MRGGYSIINLKEKTLPATIAGTHAVCGEIFNKTKKTVKVSGLVVSGAVVPECDGYLTLSSTTYTIHAGGRTITVTSADLVTDTTT